jgi:hypothetical protein
MLKRYVRVSAWLVACASLLVYVAAAVVATDLLAQPAAAKPDPRMELLKAMTGRWDVVMTFRPNPDAEPLVVKDLVAERTMIGQYLQEVMQAAPGSAPSASVTSLDPKSPSTSRASRCRSSSVKKWEVARSAFATT